MLQDELPKMYDDIGGTESLKTARINRRTSWLKPLVDDPSYSSKNGRVVLIGDAAHAMTPSLGEGCNCSLESVVKLLESLQTSASDDACTKDALTAAFQVYGRQRPPQVVPLQERSAKANRYASSQFTPPTKPAAASSTG